MKYVAEQLAKQEHLQLLSGTTRVRKLSEILFKVIIALKPALNNLSRDLKNNIYMYVYIYICRKKYIVSLEGGRLIF